MSSFVIIVIILLLCQRIDVINTPVERDVMESTVNNYLLKSKKTKVMLQFIADTQF